ncbi:trehalose-phosphatase [Georgenia sp. Z1491]|uniref:trehalose-phosphatase n=1 Tax=Georgenia sp. Z1491 TaxID=3416707 RepID=UPI003CF84E89
MNDHQPDPSADRGVPGPGIDAPMFTARLEHELDEAVAAFARRGHLLVALDFDGVLAPLVDDPTTSRMTDAAVWAVDRLAALPDVTVAVVSGRDAGTLASLADLPDGTLVVASHGAERGRIDAGSETGLTSEPIDLDDELAALRAEVLRGTEEVVAAHPGTHLEAKPASITLHTRGMSEDAARAATTELLTGPAGLPGVRVISGHDVLEMAVLTVTKGDGVLDLRAETGADAVLYAGDDRTDEDAFAVLREHDLSVKVGDGETAARFRVGDPDEFAVVLDRLAQLRA